MISGTLIINLEPAYLTFIPGAAARDENMGNMQRDCTAQEIRELLLDLSVLEMNSCWPPKELQAILPGVYSCELLIRHGLGSAFVFENMKRCKSAAVRIA